jgi:hypothetical protein
MSGLMLRWHYYDPTTGDNDWYAQIDEVGLSCMPAPVIDVDPSSLSSTQVPGETADQPLSISNLGSADLIWSIDETLLRAPAGYPGTPVTLPMAGDQSLNERTDFVPSTIPIAPRNVGIHGVPVNDGSFENGPPPASAWTETTDNLCEWIGDWSAVWGAAAFDGVFDFWGGGYCSGVPSTDSVEQSITIPGGLLSFWYLAYRVDPDDAGIDTAYLSVDGTPEWTLDLTLANNTFPNWVNVVVDLSAYSGQTVNLKLGVESLGDQTGNIRFDFLEFTGGCDLPSDIPWLGLAPTIGTTPPGGSTDVNVSTDSTALLPGAHIAKLCANSNDPVTPVVEVPVEMTVLNAPPEVTVDPESQLMQYSDEISPITITATDNIVEVLTAATSWSTDGVSFSPGLPDFLLLSGPDCIDSGGGMQTCTWTVSGVMDLPEDVYTIRAAVSDNYGGSTVADALIDVLAEDATVVFACDGDGA